MTRWFGESWGAPVCEERSHALTPVGLSCPYCLELIQENDRGVIIPYWGTGEGHPWHLDCFLRSIGAPPP